MKNKIIVLTGASSGIGEASALALAKKGHHICLLARRSEELHRIEQRILTLGGQAWSYPVDLNDNQSLEQCVEKLLAQHQHIDVLINNAGRSIRRPIIESLNRFHDYERTMQLNFFGAAKLTMALLPRFLQQGHGHIVNVSTYATHTAVPNFSAYTASKQALDAFSRSLVSELSHKGIKVSSLHYPLVRTPMSSDTQIYRHLPMMSPEKASTWIVKAVEKQPFRITPLSGILLELCTTLFPRWTTQRISRIIWRKESALQEREDDPS